MLRSRRPGRPLASAPHPRGSADAPAATAAAASSRLAMPLSNTAIRLGGMARSLPSAVGTSTTQRLEVARVDPDDLGVGRERPLQVAVRVRLQERLHPEGASARDHRDRAARRRGRPRSAGPNPPRRRATRPAGRVDQEVLAEHRDARDGSHEPADRRATPRSAVARSGPRSRPRPPPRTHARAPPGRRRASIAPALGDARFTSAITAGTGARRSASGRERAGGADRAAAASSSSWSGRSSSSRRIVPARSVRNPMERGSLPARFRPPPKRALRRGRSAPRAPPGRPPRRRLLRPGAPGDPRSTGPRRPRTSADPPERPCERGRYPVRQAPPTRSIEVTRNAGAPAAWSQPRVLIRSRPSERPRGRPPRSDPAPIDLDPDHDAPAAIAERRERAAIVGQRGRSQDEPVGAGGEVGTAERSVADPTAHLQGRARATARNRATSRPGIPSNARSRSTR